METLICPFIESCSVYKNWKEQTGDERLDMILLQDHKYECIALEALNDRETGIIKNKELEKRLEDNKNGSDGSVPNCSYIKLLNLSR